jgi:DNA repair protein RecN (Recombination protein N)
VDLLSNKLDVFKKLLNKHQVATQNELIAIYHDFLNRNASSLDLEETLNEVENQVISLSKELENAGHQLTSDRQIASSMISKKIEPYFERLKLYDAQIAFQIQAKKQFDALGMDYVDLLFSTNRGIAPQPIEKVASGGELGRLMLILMTLLSEQKALPTVIFDEIDTGVSGDVADRIGQLLREMGQHRQLLTITHLPQVAAAGHHHLSVRKIQKENFVISEVIKLDADQRQIEIAQLLSGERISEAALANAKQLLDHHD